MASTIRIKRRASGGQTGAPATLQNAELAFNESDDTLYYGKGTGGSGGSATAVIPIAGPGAYVDRVNDQTIAGNKTFNSSPLIPTPAAGDNSKKAATTEFVALALAPAPQSPNTVYAGPASGSTSSAPTFRPLQPLDIPTLTAAKISDFGSTVDARVATQKGTANGLATLDANGTVPAAQLPSYVDDVLEFTNLAAFPGTGEVGKIYVTKDTNKTYRWSGSAYIEISASPGSTDAVTEGATNLYFTQSRVRQTTLDGFAVGTNSALTAADSVLSAFQKLQGQVNADLKAALNLSDLQSVTTARTNLGLGTIAVQNANNVNITGGLIDGITFDAGTF